MAKRKVGSVIPPQILELGKEYEVKVNLINREKGSAIRGKSLDGFLGEEKQISREWDVHSVTVLIPVGATVKVVAEPEPTTDDNGGVE